jgi:fibronectin type 3 domain-containing protein
MSLNRCAALCLAIAGLTLSGCSDDSVIGVADTAPPSAPSAIRGYIKQEGRAILVWSHNTEPDLAGYNVYKGAQLNAENESLLSSPGFVTEVVENESVTYRVTAVDQAGNESAMSSVIHLQDARTPSFETVSGEDPQVGFKK